MQNVIDELRNAEFNGDRMVMENVLALAKSIAANQPPHPAAAAPVLSAAGVTAGGLRALVEFIAENN